MKWFQLRPWIVVDVEFEECSPSPSVMTSNWRVTVRHRDGTEGTGSHRHVSTAIFLAKENGWRRRVDAKDTRRAERIQRRLRGER